MNTALIGRPFPEKSGHKKRAETVDRSPPLLDIRKQVLDRDTLLDVDAAHAGVSPASPNVRKDPEKMA